MTGKLTPQIVERARSVSVTAFYTFVVYHQFSRSSSINWTGSDRKSDTSICWKDMKCFSNGFIYVCCMSLIVRIFIEFLNWRWLEKWHLNLSKEPQVFQQQLYIRFLDIINCRDLHRLFEIEMTKKSAPQFVERAWCVSLTASITIAVYHHLSGSSLVILNGDDKRTATPRFVKNAWNVSVTALYTIVVNHQLSGSSLKNWNGKDRKSDKSICRKGVKCFTNSFIYDCRITSIDRIFTDILKWRWQEKRHHNLSKRREVLQ